jgi:hypothetical protein
MRTAKMVAIVDIYRASTVGAQSTVMSRHLLHVEEPIHQLTALGAALFRPTARVFPGPATLPRPGVASVGHFREDLRLDQELVQPLEILLHMTSSERFGFEAVTFHSRHFIRDPIFPRLWNGFLLQQFRACRDKGSCTMNGLIYLVGLIVVIMFILSLLGLR